MLNIVVCEDNIEQRKRITGCVNRVINRLQCEGRIVLETNNPHEVIHYALAHTEVFNLYIMDVDLRNDVNGLEAAKEIRNVDVECNFIFITGHMEKAMLCFSYKIKALDFIDKLNSLSLEEKIEENLKIVLEESTKRNTSTASYEVMTIKSGVRSFNIPLHEIICFETLSAHKIKVHTMAKTLEFYDTMGNILQRLPAEFFHRCHKSYIINLRHAKEFNFKESMVIMDNDLQCSLSRDYIKQLNRGFDGSPGILQGSH